MFYHRILNIVPCAIHENLLSIHSKHNSLYLPTPNSQFIPLPCHIPPWQPEVCFPVYKSVSVLEIGSFVPYLDSTYK